MLIFQPIKTSTCILLLSFFSSADVFSAGNRIDYDLDNDGLIEINSLADLNEIRNNLDGKTLYGSNVGCPNIEDGGCNGFELTTSLDFDTNQDGIINSNDDYWNENSDGIGEGWLPIGSNFTVFNAIFDGQGHNINNLYINRPSTDYIGLFGYVKNAEIRNIGLTGPMTSIIGQVYAGGLIGYLHLSHVNNSFNTGSIEGTSTTGGLIGHADKSFVNNSFNSGPTKGNSFNGGLVASAEGSVINNSFNTGSVYGNRETGGLIGFLYNTQVSNTFNTGTVQGVSLYGGLLGYSLSSKINNSFSANYTSHLNAFIGYTSKNNVINNSYLAIHDYSLNNINLKYNDYVRATLASLKCATQANVHAKNSDCIQTSDSGESTNSLTVLFKDWDKATQDGSTLWHFGTDQQLPALVLNNVIYRDSDGDSSVDTHDAFPDQEAAYIDTDNDGYPDRWSINCDAACIASSGLTLDQFPLHKAAWHDDDFDGLPDSWGDNCDDTCQSTSGLELDTNLNDTDNDGINNLEDIDDNNDKVTDADADSDGLIDISSLEQLNAIRFQLDGSGLRLTANAKLDQSGCPMRLMKGQYKQTCFGYELTTDLDFDTNKDGVMNSDDTYWNTASNNNGEGWLPIGNRRSPFSTTFNGNGFDIRNLYINRIESSYSVGLFGYVSQADIHDLVLTGTLMSVSGNHDTGSLAGYSSSSQISNIVNNGSVQGKTENTGGLLGSSHESRIDKISNNGPVTGGNSTGGVIGYSKSNKINSNVNSGHIQGKGERIGGLIGTAKYNEISSSFNTGEVKNEGGYTGGLIGLSYTSLIDKSFNTGLVHGNKYVGGLIGQSAYGKIHNNFSTGAVHGVNYVGGLVGQLSAGRINYSLSTGIVSGTSNIGGLTGHNDLIKTVTNSYWASDSSKQTTNTMQLSYYHHIGLNLASLQCAVKANSRLMDSNCVINNLATTIFKNWNQTIHNGESIWDFGTSSQLPALVLNGIVYRDSDGDGLLDENDAFPFDSDNDGLDNRLDSYPFIAIGELLDTDNDGAPNTCDVDCLALGMTADLDDDKDGVLDVNDAFPLIAIGNLLDSDNDGAPDTCEADCLALNMTADLDDDNDGALDTVDAFPLDPSEHSDFDNDGTGDVADLDDDNDGVNDVDDANLGEDNGKPVITHVPSIDPIAVTTENGDAFELLVDDNFLNAFTTYDAVDTAFTYEASLNGNVLAIDENNIMLIPAGRQAVQVVAIDTSGNRSEPVEMVAIVYPQVRFEQATSIIGENSTTNIKVSLTGDAPEYPVVIHFAINELGDVTQADIDAGFDITAQHQVTIEAGDAEALNRDGFILIPIVDDNESENDELLIIDLVSAKLESETDDDIESLFVIKEDHKQHALTVTYQNLAPVVNLKLEQNGIEVENVQQDGGLVSITATVQDGNGNDTHTFTWDLNSLGLNAPLGNRLEFDPANVTANSYAINVTVTDSGVGQLTDQAVIRFNVIAPPVVVPPDVIDPKEADDTSSGGGGGGATSLWLMLLMLGLASGVRVRRVMR